MSDLTRQLSKINKGIYSIDLLGFDLFGAFPSFDCRALNLPPIFLIRGLFFPISSPCGRVYLAEPYPNPRRQT